VSNRLDDLEARLDRLEASAIAAPAVRFRFGWKDGEVYEAGETCLRGGSLWIAMRRTQPGEMPGLRGADPDADESGPWRLAAQRGREGRIPQEWEERLRALERQR
jgi:hypothetical protein